MSTTLRIADECLTLLLRDVGKCCSDLFKTVAEAGLMDDAVAGLCKVFQGSHETSLLSNQPLCGTLLDEVEGYLTREKPTKETSSLASIFLPASHGSMEATVELIIRWMHPESICEDI